MRALSLSQVQHFINMWNTRLIGLVQAIQQIETTDWRSFITVGIKRSVLSMLTLGGQLPYGIVSYRCNSVASPFHTSKYTGPRRHYLMCKTITLIALCIIFSFATASAEFYKYTDSDGNVRYTDDLSKVPESQRPNVQSYEESESSIRPADPSQKSESDQRDDAAKPGDSGSFNEERKQINQKQEALSKEYKALMEEKERLEKESKKKKDINESVEFDRKVEQMNKRVQAYEEKRKALNNEIEAFNTKMSESKDSKKK